MLVSPNYSFINLWYIPPWSAICFEVWDSQASILWNSQVLYMATPHLGNQGQY